MSPRFCTPLAAFLLFTLLSAPPSGAHEAAVLTPEQLAEAASRLEHALLSAAPGGPAVCFAPGTSKEYMEQIMKRAAWGAEPVFNLEDGEDQRFRISNRWASTATNGGGLAQGDPTTLTWSYIPDGTAIPSGIGEPAANSNLIAWLNGIYGSQPTWHAIFVAVFDRWSQLTGLTYAFQATDDGAAFTGSAGALGVRGDVRIGAKFIDGSPAGGSVLAYNFFPNNGDMVLDSADTFFNNTATSSLRLRNVLAHEHGHGIGFSHVCPVNQTKLMEPFVSLLFDGPQLDDINAGQRNYGDPLEPNNSSGSASPLGAVGGGLQVTQRSVDDNADVDFYSFTVPQATTVSVTLTPTGLSYLEGPQNANGTCQAGTNFNSLIANDVGVEIRDTDGTTVLDSANANPAGQAETASASLPAAGTYFVRVFAGANDTVQLYDLTIGTEDLIFADGFESGNTSAWSLTVP